MTSNKKTLMKILRSCDRVS